MTDTIALSVTLVTPAAPATAGPASGGVSKELAGWADNVRSVDDAQEVIRLLGLKPLPGEGGFYRETYRAPLVIPAGALPAHFGAARAASTAIYYLLGPDTVSALHRLRGDEVYHFYLGDPVELLQLRPDGTGEVSVLGPELAAGMRPQAVVPAGVWQGSRLRDGGRYALLGTTMAPGFEFSDFEPGRRAALTGAFPAFADLIMALTPES